MNLFQHLFNSGEKYTFIDNQQPKQIDFREPLEIRICLYKLVVLIASYLLGIVYHVSQLPQLLPVVFVQPQKQTWIKEPQKNAKMHDICNKETKTTAASLRLRQSREKVLSFPS